MNWSRSLNVFGTAVWVLVCCCCIWVSVYVRVRPLNTLEVLLTVENKYMSYVVLQGTEFSFEYDDKSIVTGPEKG